MLKAGFAKINLQFALDPPMPIREPIEAVSMYLEDNDSRTVWITLDFMDFNRRVCDTLKCAVSYRTGIGEENIHILTTHNHGGGTPILSRLSYLVASCAAEAISVARSALVRSAHTHTDKQYNILRRLYIPETESVSTLYFGACEENNFETALFAENVIEATERMKECNSIKDKCSSPRGKFPEGDKGIDVIEFVGEDKRSIGTIVRYAAHAVTANRQGSYSSDYPYYVRKKINEALGTITVFMNGPCAEIAPAMLNKLEGRERVLGEAIATLALNAIIDKAPTPIEGFTERKAAVRLPVRHEVIENKVGIPTEASTKREKRKRIEAIRLEHTLPFLREKYLVGNPHPCDEIEVFIGVLRLGDITIAAFPGETFYSTGEALKSAFPTERIITVTEHERTAMYMPPLADHLLGGYESVCRVTAPEAEQILRREAIGIVENLLHG